MENMTKRVLVVEDEADIQTAVRTLLENSDYEVTSAENGLVALELLEQGLQPDILLLDLMTPSMSGYSLLYELHRRGLSNTFSTIVMSGDVLTKQQIDLFGIKGFISKPFDIGELQAMIASV